MAGPRELQLILGVAERLGDELGAVAGSGIPDEAMVGEADRLQSWGQPEDARFAGRLSAALAQIAAAAAGPASDDTGEATAKRTAAAIARTELVVRGELMRGKDAALREQLPGFVFLVVLPGGGMDRALELANRARGLLDEALG